MEPSEALSTAAQISVALAGFAGVVVVFRSGSVHEWSQIDKFRLRLLLTDSILPLAFCMIAMVLLAVRPVPAPIWSWCSAFVAAFLFPRAILYLNAFLRLPQEQVEQGSRTTFFIVLTIKTAVTVLQLYNVPPIGRFWPFFTAITVQLLTGMFQFVRLVLIHRQLPPNE